MSEAPAHKFDYNNGEDYTCRLCGTPQHTSGPRPDYLCDGCRELKWRITLSPVLAMRILTKIIESSEQRSNNNVKC